MLTSTFGIPLDSSAATGNSSLVNRTTPAGSTTSFAEQLARSLEGYLSQGSAGSHLEIDILPQQGGNSGTRQFVVTVTDARPAGGVVPPAQRPLTVPATPAAQVLPRSGLFGLTSSEMPATVLNPPEPEFTNEVDAYWGSQPEAVRVLRTIQDFEERGQMGLKLASEGYVIDPNIMIHGWDPYMTMKTRLGEGYTWVPAVGQNGIPVSPGIVFADLPTYDPNNPPPGSVLVTLDFAAGLEHTSPGSVAVNS